MTINFKDRSRPFATVDMLIFLPARYRPSYLHDSIVLIERAKEPLGWALPGGHVEYGESLEEAAIREAKEETNLDIMVLEQFYTYSLPDRDPRSHTMSTAFICTAEGEPVAGDDAARVHVVPWQTAVNIARSRVFAFDHGLIIDDVDYYLRYGDAQRRRLDPRGWKSQYAPNNGK